MATVSTSLDFSTFENGDRMTRAEFHRIYETMPEDFRAELIGGIVYVASPLRRRHGTNHLQLGSLFGGYKAHTPGVEAADNATVPLGDEGEPQPDLYLRILPEFGGQSRTTSDDYIEGAPELIVEVALSSRAVDLHGKYADYRRYGVVEYLVVLLHESEIRWVDLRSNRELHLEADGICRSQTFPGLWIDPKALFSGDDAKKHATLAQGLATAEHAAFVQSLAKSHSE